MPSIEPERPRAEPEIIPPDRIAEEELRRAARLRGYESYEQKTGYQRIYIGRIGPFGMALAALIAAALAIVVVALLVGAFLIAIPIAALVVAGVVIAGWLRSGWRR
jgi:uncharacterized membrane protein